MATIKWNNGNIQDVSLENLPARTKIFLTVHVYPEDEIIKIAGHSVIDCLNIDIQDVMFQQFQLGTVSKLAGQTCNLEVNASKIKVEQSDEDGSKIPITCELNIETEDSILEEFELNDKKKLSANSIFIYKLKF